MKCPHCLVDFHDSSHDTNIGDDVNGAWDILSRNCPNCRRNVYHLRNFTWVPSTRGTVSKRINSEELIYPKGINRSPVPQEVPKEYAEDYQEACAVLTSSPKASAALSRRCLQHLIREELKIKKKDLFQEIQEVIDTGALPTDILESIDAIRNIGNFAAHPIKSTGTGEIVAVEPHEAEWNLDVLEMMFEFLFVRPAAIKKKRDALNLKLGDAGKNPMK
jgi:hypothetical protein